MGILSREITPGPETDQYFYGQAVEFANKATNPENFKKAAQEKNLQVVPVTGLRPTERGVNGLDNSRDLIHWAFMQDEAGVLHSEINNYNDKYVVVMLSKVSEAGTAPLADVTSEIKQELIKEKKAELLAQKMNDASKGASSIQAIASALGTEVLNAGNVRNNFV